LAAYQEDAPGPSLEDISVLHIELRVGFLMFRALSVTDAKPVRYEILQKLMWDAPKSELIT
jgi:hypothetical protein